MFRNFFNDNREKRNESREFWKERRHEEQTEFEKDEKSRAMDLMNACPECHIIRSPFEIGKGLCDNCDYTKLAI